MDYPGVEEHTDPQIITTQQARQGEVSGHMRYVLGIGLALAVLAGVLLYALNLG